MQDRWERRMYGPEGWTADLRADLEAFFEPCSSGGLEWFSAVPYELAERIARQMATANVDGYDEEDGKGPPGYDLVLRAGRRLGPDATFSGFAVECRRHDERIELRGVQVDVTGWSIEQIRSACDDIWEMGLDPDVEHGPDHRRITVR